MFFDSIIWKTWVLSVHLMSIWCLQYIYVPRIKLTEFAESTNGKELDEWHFRSRCKIAELDLFGIDSPSVEVDDVSCPLTEPSDVD